MHAMRAVQNVTCGPALEKRDRRTLLIREAIACLCPGPSTSAELPVNVVNFSWPSLSCNIFFPLADIVLFLLLICLASMCLDYSYGADVLTSFLSKDFHSFSSLKEP